MNKIKIIIIVLVSFIGLAGCGEGTIDISEAKYESKIVVDAYLYPHKKVESFIITRNIPLDKNVDYNSIVITNADVKLTDLSDGKEYKLVFNPMKASYEYDNDDLTIEYGKTYKLEVEALIDGKKLKTSATTTVPLNGFHIKDINKSVIHYREKDEAGNIRKVKVEFAPTSNAQIYGISISAVNPSISSFIYDNAYSNDIDSNDVKDDFDRYKHEIQWLQNSMNEASTLDYDIEWHSIWFYGNYRVVMYAGDKNFKDFFLTQNDVQEMDGNFHEPKLHMEGDGIGVFASAIADTIYFNVIK